MTVRVDGPGLSIDLPSGWEAEIEGGAGGVTTRRAHVANFALPADRGDFGSNAVERMGRGDALICLLEEDPHAAGTRLHAGEGIPTLSTEDFGSQAMQRPLPGQVGAQAFFHVAGRAFVLYVVLVPGLRLGSLVDEVNRVLGGVRTHPRP